MNTKENKRSIIVGLFVLIGLIILVAGILVLGTQQNKFSKNLLVTTYFKDVKGLKVGNNVWFSGVKVGIIKEVAFEDVADVRVVMSIEEKSSEFIRKDVTATLGSDGLIGNAIISLLGGTSTFPAIEDGDTIKSGPSGGMDQMLDMLQSNGANLLEITKNFALLSGQIVEGKGTVGALMTDDAIANNLKQTTASLNQIMLGVQKTMNNVVALTNKLNNNQGLIHDLTTDTTVFASLRESAAQLQNITATANTLMANLNQTSARLNDKNNVIGVLTNDDAAAAEIKQILENLNAGTHKLDQNMEALQSNFLFRGFFKKKAKEEAARAKDSIQ
ncbi:MCE family protein [Sphingobacterium sp. SGG-5]|uniref:MlaD family protein n=1 Tax=Sphingobacterium sp. SGG-5 TaxID=2710881 RepID=UPI0013EB575D|nr:MlaD family protein [Sphingobacterium sp. SGG-5]NGM62921.1 MCE family protein [Sphingobacterium sp. SGG-5]